MKLQMETWMRQQSRKSLRGGRREAALEVMWRSQEGAAVPDPADRSGAARGGERAIGGHLGERSFYRTFVWLGQIQE